MLKKKEKLEQYLEKEILKIISNTELCIKIYDYIKDKYDIPRVITSDYISMRLPLEQASEFILFCLLDGIEKIINKNKTDIDKFFTMQEFKTYKDSPVTAFMIASVMLQMDYSSLKALHEMLGEPAKTCFYGQLIAIQLAALKQVEPGSVAPDFKGVTLNGDTLSLHGIKARVKLLDFWASWCEPCRRETPNVRKIYQKYHDKGLEIIGVSLDDKKQEWAKAMKNDKVTWPNVSDLKGKNSEIAARYFIRGIPHTILLDEDNRIVAKNLRGKALEKKIAELLGGK